MAKIETRFGSIGYSRSGDGPGIPLIFLHGVGSDKSVWQSQLDAFGDSLACFAFDYPGYGESDFIAGAGRDDFASAILAAMDELGIGKAHICGLSLGGVIAIAMHAMSPERCASLVLADTFAVHPDGQAIFDRSIAASRQMGMRDLAKARAGALLGSASTEQMYNEVIETMSAIDPNAYALGADAVWLADQRDRVAEIKVPTLVICGDEDAITPTSLSEILAGSIDDADLVIISRSGHLANLEQPSAFNRAIASFLAGL